MAKLIADDLRVCQDCLCWIANGDTGDTETNAKCAQAYASTLKRYDAEGGSIVPSGDENEEGSFSWRECDCCGGLAGDRHAAAIIL